MIKPGRTAFPLIFMREIPWVARACAKAARNLTAWYGACNLGPAPAPKSAGLASSDDALEAHPQQRDLVDLEGAGREPQIVAHIVDRFFADQRDGFLAFGHQIGFPLPQRAVVVLAVVAQRQNLEMSFGGGKDLL